MSGPLQWSQKHGRMVPATGVLPPDDVEEPVAQTEALAEMPRLAPARKSSQKSKSSTPINVLRLAKARLKEVNAELRRMKTLEKERGELERLIAAAEVKKPSTPPMRVVKSAG